MWKSFIIFRSSSVQVKEIVLTTMQLVDTVPSDALHREKGCLGGENQ